MYLIRFFNEILEGIENFSKLKLENSFLLEKNGLIPHFLVGVFSGLGILTNLIPASHFVINVISKSLVDFFANTLGSLVVIKLDSPLGNTKSYQSLLTFIKLSTIILLIKNNDHELVKEEDVKKILEQKTGRARKISCWQTNSSQLYNKFFIIGGGHLQTA